ncbi:MULTISPECIES: PTS sugar transporter subunit IIA [Carnobacterium]|uniref:Mannitol-specific phosphotransferase enzyme IIA component n=1 Tax=Carnobacterium antarcticum TaxID=2126436 RepID=A0ABW4NNP3_9LACT|nr:MULTISPECIES: PTS sugar transporter subunit IIA [unclassified Carnobacterium]ALV22559.1 PTS system, mannitol-specific IIA component [Carnobacterium sp. CP1]QQP70473.1 PTS sugar transporter subunit IIA [Carnobacterium sp. CS13]
MATLTKELIELGATAETKEEAIRLVGNLLVESGAVNAEYVESMLEREQTVSTYMGNFIAIPHGTDASKKDIYETAISVATFPKGIDFSETSDENKVFVLFGIAGKGDEHLDLLSSIAIFCSEIENVQKLIEAATPEEVIELLKTANE